MFAQSSPAAEAATATPRTSAPHVIHQTASVFLVSRCGELWRVFDASAPGDAVRQMPSPASKLPHRVFLALAKSSDLRVHTFTSSGART
ncbi:MAG: hypothetical protein ACREMU_12235, partial [Gemmatimonadaceae bacterium]